MTDEIISDLDELTTVADGDLLPIVDISEANVAIKTKKITKANLVAGLGGGALTDHTHAVTGSGATGGGNALTPVTLDVSGEAELSADVVLNGIVLADVAASQNNYAPTGWATASLLILRNTAGAEIDITGISSSGIEIGQILVVMQDSGGNNIRLKHANTSSTDVNRLNLPNNVDLLMSPHGAVIFQYTSNNAAASRWRAIGVSVGMLEGLLDAKGDLISATADNTAARVAVGANDTILMADSGQSAGLKWVASQTPSTQAFGDAAAEGTADTYARGDHKHAMPANPKLGSISVAAGAMIRPVTSPASAITQTESATNDQNQVTMDFADGSTTYAEWETIMPSDWDGGTFTAKFYWRATGTSTNSVRWQVEARSYGDDETIDQAWGTAQAVDDAHTATADRNLISAATGACTPSGTPAGGELLKFRFARLGGHANDTLAQTVSLIGVLIAYTRT